MPDTLSPDVPLYDSQFLPSGALQQAFADFVAVVRQLRRDCPWDREQTHASIKHLTLEEAYEVAHAVDEQDWDELEGELGDLLLHGLFHSGIAEEKGRFTLASVLRRETQKLIRRHPHVFGEEAAENAEAVRETWEAVKRAERTAGEQEEVPSALDGVPEALPALLKAERVQQKAAGAGFDFATRAASWEQLEEELREFRETQDASAEEREEELGDLLFALTAYARREGLVAENALRRTIEKFSRRFRHVEPHLVREDPLSPERLRALWDEAKQAEDGVREERDERDKK